MQKNSIVLLGHGSKSKDAIEDFNFVVNNMNEKAENINVFGAHMELATPSLEDVFIEINKMELEDILVLPYFLFNGNHIKMDIPAKIEALKIKYPNMNIKFGTPIGKEPLMADLLLRKANDAL